MAIHLAQISLESRESSTRTDRHFHRLDLVVQLCSDLSLASSKTAFSHCKAPTRTRSCFSSPMVSSMICPRLSTWSLSYPRCPALSLSLVLVVQISPPWRSLMATDKLSETHVVWQPRVTSSSLSSSISVSREETLPKRSSRKFLSRCARTWSVLDTIQSLRSKFLLSLSDRASTKIR